MPTRASLRGPSRSCPPRCPDRHWLRRTSVSPASCRPAQRRWGEMAALYQARRQALPLADDCADAVLCHVALMLTDDAPQVLAEARRVLKTGGLFSAVVVGGGGARLGDRRLHPPEGIA
ncbi:MAG: methyltransferase domain-containing protein [Bdellovibrionales bacterium]|nr:methyltransferase domain-containing protein [Massilia sp.]